MGRMSSADRAKQFMPFAALKGYDEAIAELNLMQEPRITLGEDAAQELDERLRALRPGDMSEIRYYNRRAYESLVGRVMLIDMLSRRIVVGTAQIDLDDIIEAEKICE